MVCVHFFRWLLKQNSDQTYGFTLSWKCCCFFPMLFNDCAPTVCTMEIHHARVESNDVLFLMLDSTIFSAIPTKFFWWCFIVLF